MATNKDFDAYLSSLYTRFHDELLNWGYKKTNYRPETKELVEEWINEAFVRAMKNPAKIMAHTEPIAWFKTTFKHIMKDYFRHQRKKQEKFGTAVPQDPSLQLEDMESRIEKWTQHYDDKKLLAEILSLLTDEEQAVFQRYFGKRMSIEAVANALEKNPGAVKSMIQRIRKKARDHKKIFAK